MAGSSLGSSYGAYNPSAVDPYPIESVLAPLAAPDSAQAQTMLDLYQLQRQAGSNAYGAELDKQHDFNRQQLAQQLKESYLKAGPDYLKEAGGADLLSANPEFAGALGLTPTALAQAAGRSNQAHDITNLKNLGEGGLAFSSAGMPIPETAIQGMTGLPFRQGVRPDVQIGAGHDAARLAAASIHAASQSDPHAGESLPFQDASGVQGNLTRGKLNDAQWEAAKRAKGILPADQSGQIKPSPLPGQGTTAPTGASPAKQAAGRVAPAPVTPQPGTGKQQNTAPNEAAISKKIVEFMHNPASRVPTQVRDDVMQNAAKNNGQVVRKVDPSNPGKGLQIQGASGNYY